MKVKRRPIKKQACQHKFSLTPNQKNCYLGPQEDILCECKGSQFQVACAKCYNGPVYNNDQSPHTPAFIMKCDEKTIKQMSSKIQRSKTYIFFNDDQSKSILLKPKPNTKKLFCYVCRCKYKDYLDHIQGLLHKHKIQKNKYTKYIINLTNRYTIINRSESAEKKENAQSQKQKQQERQDEEEIQENQQQQWKSSQENCFYKLLNYVSVPKDNPSLKSQQNSKL